MRLKNSAARNIAIDINCEVLRPRKTVSRSPLRKSIKKRPAENMKRYKKKTSPSVTLFLYAFLRITNVSARKTDEYNWVG